MRKKSPSMGTLQPARTLTGDAASGKGKDTTKKKKPVIETATSAKHNNEKTTIACALPSRDKTSHTKVSMVKVFSILTPEYKMMFLALGGISISASATMAFPAAIGQMIDLLSLPSTDTTIYEMQKISLGMVGVFSVGALATAGHSAILETVGQKVGARLRATLFERIINQDMDFFDQNRAGELANRLSTDVHEVAEHLVENVAKFLESFVKSVSAVAAMLMISPFLTGYSSAIFPAVIIGAIFYGRYIKRLSRKHLDALATSTHLAAERFLGITTVVSFVQKDHEVQRYSRVIQRAFTLARKVAVFQAAFLGSSYFAGNAALLGVLWVGGGMVLDSAMTAGQLASFCIYAGHLSGCATEITESASGFLRAQGSGSRLFALLDKEPPKASGIIKLPTGFKGVIRFENVSFAYPNAPTVPVLQNLTMTVPEGEFLAVTGRSGCGKSSLLALLLRLYEPSEGKITLDGIDIKHLDMDWLRSQIGMVCQEPLLFAASIRENIAYGRPDATFEEIQDAAEKANAHGFITSLPDGYDSMVGERGTALSGGQKQRLAIARAILTKPRILVFDEGTSALDSVSERHVFNSLRNLVACTSSPVTLIAAAHQISTLAAAERLIVLDEGKLLEEGKFDTLLSHSPSFQELMKGGRLITFRDTAVSEEKAREEGEPK